MLTFLVPTRIMTNSSRPLLAITMGDPAGIGPEIIAKALAGEEVFRTCRPLVVGDALTMEEAAKIVKARFELRRVVDPAQGLFQPGVMDILDLRNVDLPGLVRGRVSAMAGRVAVECVRAAVELAERGVADGIVTAPLNKEAMNEAGFHYDGHTELLAHLTKTPQVSMMLATEKLKVAHVTTHVALREACDRIRRDRVMAVIRLADEAARRLGAARPRVGVAGLNPHAGEGGLFGREDMTEIAPAVAQAVAEGINAQGPIPGDTLFLRAIQGEFDVAVAMFHDQGHIPVKLAGFAEAVNVTLGLPILRVSVDHGTAFDKAGKGTASEENMLAAIRFATRMLARGAISIDRGV